MYKRIERQFLLFSVPLLLIGILFSSLSSAFTDKNALLASGEPSLTVVIDAGHGGVDAGAIAVNGALEKDLNLSLALLLSEHFEKRGVRVVLTRSEDALVLREGDDTAPSFKERDLYNRASIADASGGTLLVSIHMNAFPDGKYRGLEVYHDARTALSRRIAEKIRSTVIREHEPYNTRALKAGGSLYLLSHTAIPAVLIECGFLSNAEDAAKLSDKDYQKKLSFSIFCAIMEVIDS